MHPFGLHDAGHLGEETGQDLDVSRFPVPLELRHCYQVLVLLVHGLGGCDLVHNVVHRVEAQGNALVILVEGVQVVHGFVPLLLGSDVHAEGPVALVDEEALDHPLGSLGFEVDVGVLDSLTKEIEGFDHPGGGGRGGVARGGFDGVGLRLRLGLFGRKWERLLWSYDFLGLLKLWGWG